MPKQGRMSRGAVRWSREARAAVLSLASSSGSTVLRAMGPHGPTSPRTNGHVLTKNRPMAPNIMRSFSRMPRFVYRTIQVGSREHEGVLAGEDVRARCLGASHSIREHVLRGSSSKWEGSQFISTTIDLDVALRFAVPCHPIICIDIERFTAQCGGQVVDLSSLDKFELSVPPDEVDRGSTDRAAIERRKAELFGGRYGQLKHDKVLQDVQWLWGQAAYTPWECSRLFSLRSREMLLSGTIPSECYQLLDYRVHATDCTYLERNALPELPPFDEWRWKRSTGQKIHSGAMADVAGCPGRFHLKQARANKGAHLTDFARMREGIDLEFAALSFYRLVEVQCPPLQVRVPDCVKVTFDITIEYPMIAIDHPSKKKTTRSLKCILSENIEGLQPVRVQWRLSPLSMDQMFDKIFGPTVTLSGLQPDHLRPPRSPKFYVTTEGFVARQRNLWQISDTRAAEWLNILGPGKLHRITRYLASEFANPEPDEGTAGQAVPSDRGCGRADSRHDGRRRDQVLQPDSLAAGGHHGVCAVPAPAPTAGTAGAFSCGGRGHALLLLRPACGGPHRHRQRPGQGQSRECRPPVLALPSSQERPVPRAAHAGARKRAARSLKEKIVHTACHEQS